MSISWKNWRRGFAALLIALGAHATAFAQTPTFSLEGVVSDAQQAVLPGATVTITNTATGLTRTVVTDAGGRYVITSMPTEGRYRVQVELTGFANAVREDIVFNAGQRALINFSLRLSTVQETITVAGDAPIVQTTSSEVSTHDRSPGVRNAAGEGAQLLPAADARLERGRERHGLQRPQRRRPGSVELRHLRGWHQQPLEVADAAARAAARVERLRDRDGQGSAAHHQPVLGRVRRPLRRRVEHDHQDRHQRVQRLGVRDDPARRSGRGPAAGADRQRREGQGAVQPAAVRRHRPAARSSATRCSSSAATSGVASAARWWSPPSRLAGPIVPTPADEHQGHAKIDMRFNERQLARRPLQHGPLEQGQRERRPQPAGHRLHLGQQRRHGARHVHDDLLRQGAERGSRPVLALHRSPRREVRVRVDRAPGLLDLRRQRSGHLGRAAGRDLRPVDDALALVRQPHDEDGRVVHV